ncbi:MAG: DUF4465 domain-containing protein [Prevotellaceae bacterium]|nr:DUF4465 domain-containing protein [Prevotellaceae bacterium]
MTRKLFFATFAAASVVAASCNKNDEADNNVVTCPSVIVYDTVAIDFSDLALAANSHWDGSDSSGKFAGGKAVFLNSYNAACSSWGGFAYSNQNDASATGITAQFDVYTATPSSSGIFAVGYMDAFTPTIPTVTFDEPVVLQSADFALNTYAYKSMKDGDGFSKQFTTGDWYKITVKNVDSSGVATDSLEVYLADFRDGKSVFVDDWGESQEVHLTLFGETTSILVNNWTNFSLAPLGTATKLTFEVSSTDNGPYGMNTPAYFCMDNLVVCVPKKD